MHRYSFTPRRSRHVVALLGVALVIGASVMAPAAAVGDDRPRVRVCDMSLELNREPHQRREGVLHRNESFVTRKLSDSGTYAYGLAYGHINRVGWVRASGLCRTGLARRTSDVPLVGDRVRVCADEAAVTTDPNQGWQGTLDAGESVRVRDLSASGKYAYGLAYGHINRLGWVHTAALCRD